MRWAEHLSGRNLVELYLSGRAPLSATARNALWDKAYQEEQRRLALLQESFRHEVARCSLRLDKVPHETRRWLKSVDPAKPHGRPFALEQTEATLRRYQAVWEKYLCYCVRVYRLGRTEASEKHGVRFTDEQWTALDAMAEALTISGDATESGQRRGGRQAWQGGPPAAESDDDEDDYHDDDDDSDSDDDRNHNDHHGAGEPTGLGSLRIGSPTGDDGSRPEHSKALDRRVYRFCILSLKQKVPVEPFANPLIHFTAILGILDPAKSSGGPAGRTTHGRLGWSSAAQFTQQLAGLMWCGRILLLEHFFELEPIDGDPNEIDAAVVEDFPERYRCWLADGSGTPFSAIIRMMAYGKGHRSKEGGTPRLMWESGGQALRYLGQR
ncbi:hypothetical protein LZ32DRAFT_510768, partial [Colletotrichum eremochloae]